MTSRDKLIDLVEKLPEEQADELLRRATDLYLVPDQRWPLPTFVGIGDSGRSDVSERVDDLLIDDVRWLSAAVTVAGADLLC